MELKTNYAVMDYQKANEIRMKVNIIETFLFIGSLLLFILITIMIKLKFSLNFKSNLEYFLILAYILFFFFWDKYRNNAINKNIQPYYYETFEIIFGLNSIIIENKLIELTKISTILSIHSQYNLSDNSKIYIRNTDYGLYPHIETSLKSSQFNTGYHILKLITQEKEEIEIRFIIKSKEEYEILCKIMIYWYSNFIKLSYNPNTDVGMQEYLFYDAQEYSKRQIRKKELGIG